jgi:small lipoprotein (TIGR04454 family)
MNMNIKTTMIIAVFSIGMANCGGPKVSEEVCVESLGKAFDVIAAKTNPEAAQTQNPALKSALIENLKKKCMNGKIDTQCLDKATSPIEISGCLK